MTRLGCFLLVVCGLLSSGCTLADCVRGIFGDYDTSADRPVDPQLYRDKEDSKQSRRMWWEEQNVRSGSATGSIAY